MNSHQSVIILAALSMLLAGCERSDKNTAAENPAPPAAAAYSVTVSGVSMTNIDSGEPLIVEGFPIGGGELTVGP